MPKFEKQKGKSNGNSGGGAVARNHQITVGNCHACVSPMRNTIDKMLALGTSYSEIERVSGIGYRSISNHDKKHLSYEEAAIRRIVEREAEIAQENIEDGVKGVTSRRAYTEIALHKAKEALLSDDVQVTPKEALGIIEYMDRMDKEVEGAAIDEYKIQFNAFLQAIRESVSEDQHTKILLRVRELLGSTTINGTAKEPEKIEARTSIDAAAKPESPSP